MTIFCKFLTTFVYLIWLCGFVSNATAQVNTQLDSLIKVIDEHRYAIGQIVINKSTKTITMPGWVNMDSNVVEYLAVTPMGKTHESVLVLDIVPLHLQISLLLLGYDYGGNLQFQGDTTSPKGDSLDLTAFWITAEGDTVSYPASYLLKNIQTDQQLPQTAWTFSGSFYSEGNFAADLEGSVIASYSDPAAILNNPLPDRIDDAVIGANSKILPPKKTKIILQIKPVE